MTELLQEGVVLMIVGMGVVFVLLTLLVFVVQAVSKLSNALAPVAAPSALPLSSGRTGAIDEEIVSAIGAAVRQHRRRRNREP